MTTLDQQTKIAQAALNLGKEPLNKALMVLARRGIQPFTPDTFWFRRAEVQSYFNTKMARNRSFFSRLDVDAEPFFTSVTEGNIVHLIHLKALVAATLGITTSGAKALRDTGKTKLDKNNNTVKVFTQNTSDINSWKSFRDEISTAVQLPYLLGNNMGLVDPKGLGPLFDAHPSPEDVPEVMNIDEQLNVLFSPVTVGTVIDKFYPTITEDAWKLSITKEDEGYTASLKTDATCLSAKGSNPTAALQHLSSQYSLPLKKGLYKFRDTVAVHTGRTYKALYGAHATDSFCPLHQSKPSDWGQWISDIPSSK